MKVFDSVFSLFFGDIERALSCVPESLDLRITSYGSGDCVVGKIEGLDVVDVTRTVPARGVLLD